MSILRLNKVSLVGLTEQKPRLLDALQELGVMHVIPLQDAEPRPTSDESVNPERLKRALQYLISSREKRRQVVRLRQFNLSEMLDRIDHNRTQRLDLMARRDFLEKRITDLTPWGDFILPELADLAGQKLWFYLVPNYKLPAVERSGLTWSCVHRDNRHAYVVVLSEHEPDANRMPVTRTFTGNIPLSQLEQNLEDLEIELEAVEAEREALTRWIYQLQRCIADTEDRAFLADVSDQTLDYEEIFAIQGWVAEKHLAEVERFANTHQLALLIEQPKADELPPTLLDNPEKLRGGQELVSFFQMPGYRSWDPSRVVFFSFAAFFAIIMSDAGYAALMGLVLAYYWKNMASSETSRRLRSLAVTLTATSLVWGVLVGSYFGANAPFSWLASLKVLDLQDFDAMMRFSITFGALHLVLANLMMAWVRRTRLEAWASVGWALAVLSCLLGWLQGFHFIHWFVFVVAVLTVLLMSNQQQKWQLRQVMWGALALTNITKLFGDVLSYLRLFALGLASASLAITFNQLSVDVASALPGIGVFLQLLILLAGHLLNFVLTVVSGVIHGLRLNLIEFYNWSLADEGYAFRSFSKQEVTPWTT
ncbi:V-type ATP synthase subunit I [Nitrincola tibetensis]|uniref:V-type ATP synthase subunit I n=1 Tax=Nitrincola tibetensis TaxID=2219697 RepID=A0A364NQQ7_9GAMM|nr:V-type ATP synthase subunit I [Nitrincola tibetensis]RAU19406.1 V-type ATP synthase subunit I [Nitrincola tibetensis]